MNEKEEIASLLRQSAHAYFAERWGANALRVSLESDVDSGAGVWRDFDQTIGAAGLLIPERFGGQGLGYREAAVLLEESAKHLFAGPLLTAAVLAPSVLTASTDEKACAEYLPNMASGACMCGVAVDDALDHPTVAAKDGAAWRLSGAKAAVIAAGSADLLLVLVQDAGLFAVAANAAGVSITPLDVLDRSRRQARVTFDGAEGRHIDANAGEIAALVADVGAFAAAAEQLGVCQRALDLAVEYAKTRQQFGQAIGSFQAVKHLCAEMLTRTECLRAAVQAAAVTLDDGTPRERTECAAIAKAYGSEAALFVTQTLIQILGGVGFTWEHPAHLFLRRAKSLQFAFGDAVHHRARLAELVGLR